MATFGPLNEPFLLTTLEPDYLLVPIPQGGLKDVVLPGTPPEAISAQVQSAFPYPPAAFGFMIDVELDLQFDRLETPYVLTSALVAEGSHMEPTTGQIWPR